MTALYGLIGYPLSHSRSESYFTDKFRDEAIAEMEYRTFEIEHIEQLPLLLAEHRNLRGLSVTIPYKELVIPYLTAMSDQAQRIGAVNCVKIDGDRLTGHNTDAYGFQVSLLALIGDERPHALVLGDGGAAKAVKYLLTELGINYTTVSRRAKSGALQYNEVGSDTIATNRLIINTTPLGMFPHEDGLPTLPYQYITPNHYLYDLIYNPVETLFLKRGKAQGAHTLNGEAMFVAQAERAWQIWNSHE